MPFLHRHSWRSIAVVTISGLADYSFATSTHDRPDTRQQDAEDWEKPLLFSLLAGLSTCLGAAVVFCMGRTKSSKQDQLLRSSSSSSPISHRHMSFSLALAGSVMVTVSLVSILPETFEDDGNEDKNGTSEVAVGSASSPASAEGSFQFVSVGSRTFIERSISLLLGCALYLLLSKCAFPEPETILGMEEKVEGKSTADDESICENCVIQVQDISPHPSPPRGKNRNRLPSGDDDPDGIPISDPRNSKYLRARNLSNSDSEVCESKDEDEYLDAERQGLVKTPTAARQSPSPPPPSSFNSSCAWVRSYSTGADLQNKEARRAWRVATLLFCSLAAHNFPEGLAVAASTMHSQHLGLTTTLAIALHNIPEGIAIAIPCLAARPDSPWLAFGLASLSGLAEPFGAAVALCVLHGVDRTGGAGTDKTDLFSFLFNMDNILAFVAGVMVMVAVTELFPEAARHTQEGRLPLFLGTITGAIIMIASEAYLDS